MNVYINSQMLVEAEYEALTDVNNALLRLKQLLDG